jgi:hypothetical protein
MNKKLLFSGILVFLLMFSFVGCSKKDGGSSGGGKETPASDFKYDISPVFKADGLDLIRILEYTGKGGKVVIPAEIEGIEVAEIGANAFLGEGKSGPGPGYDLTEVVIPGTVVIINLGAFSSCKKLTSVTIQRTYVALGPAAFYGCENLTTLNIPDKNDNPDIGANVLGPYGLDAEMIFYGCTKLPLKMRERLTAMGFTRF